MTPRPPTHREPTDEEMQCLPEGTLRPLFGGGWAPSYEVGGRASWSKECYAVPALAKELAHP